MTRPAGVVVESELRLDPEQAVQGIEWRDVFGADGPVEVEIGIGKGRFLLDAAEKRPEINHLGVEWANKYLRFAESRAQRRGLDNVRFVRVDAREMMASIPDRSVETFYVFYPDPWPKKRHHKRRFLREDMAAELARVLVDGGKLHVATGGSAEASPSAFSETGTTSNTLGWPIPYASAPCISSGI